MFVNENTTGSKHLTLMEREERQSCRRRSVFDALCVTVLQRAKLVLSQYFPHCKAPDNSNRWVSCHLVGEGGGNLPEPPKSPLTNWQLNTTKSTPSPNRLSLLNQLMVRYSKVSSNLLKEYLDISKIKVPSKNLITSYCLICQRYF